MPAGGHRPSDSSGLLRCQRCRDVKGRKLTETTPDFAIIPIQLEDALEVLNRLGPLVCGAEDATHAIHGWDGSWVCAESVLVGRGGLFRVT